MKGGETDRTCSLPECRSRLPRLKTAFGRWAGATTVLSILDGVSCVVCGYLGWFFVMADQGGFGESYSHVGDFIVDIFCLLGGFYCG